MVPCVCVCVCLSHVVPRNAPPVTSCSALLLCSHQVGVPLPGPPLRPPISLNSILRRLFAVCLLLTGQPLCLCVCGKPAAALPSCEHHKNTLLSQSSCFQIFPSAERRASWPPTGKTLLPCILWPLSSPPHYTKLTAGAHAGETSLWKQSRFKFINCLNSIPGPSALHQYPSSFLRVDTLTPFPQPWGLRGKFSGDGSFLWHYLVGLSLVHFWGPVGALCIKTAACAWWTHHCLLAGFLTTEKGDHKTAHYAVSLGSPPTDTFSIINANWSQKEPG